MRKKAQLQAAALGGSPDEVEAAFYEALQKADLTLMMRCWGDEDDMVCILPGGPRHLGGAAIRSAFEHLMAGGGLRIVPQHVRRVVALAAATHSVLERIEVQTPEGPRHAYVLATNTYHKTAQGWRLVAHHASPATAEDVAAASGGSAVLH